MAGLVLIHTYGSRFEADIAKSALEAAGIGALVRADDAGGFRPSLWVGTGVQLFVADVDAERAAEILDTTAHPRPTLHKPPSR